MKEGHAPLPRGEKRPRSFSPLGFGHKSKGEGRSRSFHALVLATNGVVNEGRAPFTSRFGPQIESERRPRSFHSSVLAKNYREMKEGRVPFISRFWPRSFSSLGFGHKSRGKGGRAFFHASVLARNRKVKEGRAPFTPQTER